MKNINRLKQGRMILQVGLVWLVSSWATVGFAQTGKQVQVGGKVVDAQSKSPLEYASVRIFKKVDSSFVAGAITSQDGKFSFESPAGMYYGLVEFMGYEVKKVNQIQVASSGTDLGTLELKVSASLLNEVTVQGAKSSMEMTLDKKIFNVGSDLANAGGTAADVLTNIPSVAVDVEGNVSLRGSNSVRILIDGKPSGLVSLKGGSGLQQLQGNIIERVEIITNPSARYEAEGLSGIINIILKKEQKQGFNASFDVVAGNPTNFGVAANLNYRRKNLNFFINYGLSYRNAPGKNSQYQELYRNDSTFITEKEMTTKLKGQYNSARGGLDYYINDKNVLTAAYTYRISKGKRFSTIQYKDYLSSLSNLSSSTVRTQDEDEEEPNSEYAITYKKTFDRKGQEFVFDVRYLDNWEDSDQFYGEQRYRPDGTKPVPFVLQRALNFETEKQLLFQADYVHPIGKTGKFEAGGRSSSRDMTNDYAVTQETETGWIALPGLTNDFLYQERIHAVYGILGNKSGKFSYQAGLRAEWTDLTTKLRQTNEVNDRSYADLFPSIHATYDLPKQNALQLSYSRRIRRPQYNDLTPFATYSDNRNYWSGNPDLNPEYTNSFEIGHIKYLPKGSFSSSLYYRYTTGKIVSYKTVDEEGIAFTRPENIGTEDAYGAEFTTSQDLFSWWKMDASINFFRAIIDGTRVDESLESDTYSWFTRVNSKFTLYKSVDLQVRGNYEARQRTPQGIRKALATLDLAASKDVLKGNGTLTLSVTDVFNSRKNRSITEGVNFYSTNVSQGRLRQVNLMLNYRLHQTKKKNKNIVGEY